MEKRPEITICIVVWNEEDRILRCLDSLGTLGSETELLLLDNGSTDRTLEQLAAFAAAHPGLAIRIVNHPENNLGLARRRAVELANGRWIAFIDADCVATPGSSAKRSIPKRSPSAVAIALRKAAAFTARFR
jgi:glycosyltransferase involved in cell wall biosynthesis